jgi:hypothetical protein
MATMTIMSPFFLFVRSPMIRKSACGPNPCFATDQIHVCKELEEEADEKNGDEYSFIYIATSILNIAKSFLHHLWIRNNPTSKPYSHFALLAFIMRHIHLVFGICRMFYKMKYYL